MKWYIGQEIVCIESHRQGVIKKGQVFTIKGLQTSRCKCNEIDIDIGIKAKNTASKCRNCGWIDKTKSDIWWFSEKRFAPLDFDISELTDILEQPKELIKN